jgi:hypothetical protein
VSAMPDESPQARATRLLEAATPGPWEWRVSRIPVVEDGELSYLRCISAGSDDNTVAEMRSDFTTVDADAELIAAAPSLIRQLCDAMTRVTEMIDKTDRPDWELTDYGQGAARFARRLRRVMNGEDEYPPTPPVATKGERE